MEPFEQPARPLAWDPQVQWDYELFTCPVCGSKVIKDAGQVAVRCVNAQCPAQLKRRIEHFASRGAMDLDLDPVRRSGVVDEPKRGLDFIIQSGGLIYGCGGLIESAPAEAAPDHIRGKNEYPCTTYDGNGGGTERVKKIQNLQRKRKCEEESGP